MKPIYLVIPIIGVGGAEKRLAEVWLELSRRGLPMRMIAPAETVAQLLRRPDLAGLDSYKNQIATFIPRGPSFIGRMRGLLPVLRAVPRGAIFHYPLAFPPLFHRWRGDRVILSWVATILPPLKADKSALANWLISRWSIAAADRLDVLNPDVAAKLRRDPKLARKLSITAGGTFVDFDHFKPAATKRDEVVFLGAILRAKGVLEFVHAIPEIHRRLIALGRKPSFRLIGKPGDASESITKLLGTPEFADVEIEVGPTVDPAAALATAKAMVSLQHQSNFPSKALAEAMACGCVPIISDVGESRLMATEASAIYLRPGYDRSELVEAVIDVFTLGKEAFGKRSEGTRADAMSRFSMASQVAYFERLYCEASGHPT